MGPMIPPLLGMAGFAEGIAAQVVALSLLALTAGGVLLVAGCVFRSASLAIAATVVCLLLAGCVGPAAFSPPPDTDDPDAHHWYAADRAVGWYSLGLAVASVGCLGLVGSNPHRPAPEPGAAAMAPEPQPILARHIGWWLLQSVSGTLVLVGGGVALSSGQPCCLVVLLCVGIACVGLTIKSPNED
jgi:hypothetical protein